MTLYIPLPCNESATLCEVLSAGWHSNVKQEFDFGNNFVFWYRQNERALIVMLCVQRKQLTHSVLTAEGIDLKC